MNPSDKPSNEKVQNPRTGQGYNDARGEVPDKKDVPKHNGQNVNNDPAHLREKKGASNN